MVGAIPTLLLCAALLCAIIATFALVQDFPRWHWFPAALMFLVACMLLGGPLQHLLVR